MGRAVLHYREVSNAAGARKPSESQKKNKRPFGHEGSQGHRREEFCDPARKDTILGRKQTRLELWEEHLKDTIIALDKALKCQENPC